ncbi:MAG: SUMF1/EgtB/PvdO family nonheme iron enzyme [Bacteroidales bacterium]|jgi:formylglycine-generating enzyme required for sulfatase activity|nr:SUMF1/EgtB/PvdO family nonheme iron enzyme [Bacteroidales bacterium]
MKHNFLILLIASLLLFSACGGSSTSSKSGGELVGVPGMAWREPSPYGMLPVPQGFINIGPTDTDSLWGISTPRKPISVEAFWMDETEITNSKYKQFVYWVRDSIIRERLADPAYGGNDLYKITEDQYGDPVEPHLDWSRPIPWKRPDEDEERALNSVMMRHPVLRNIMLDASQMNYKYSTFDYAQAALRRNRLNPSDRILNTDIPFNPNEIIMISKDTAYINEEGLIVRETISRQLSNLFDFENSYIVNIYPDTTCWVNDFNNAYNEPYMRMYFSHPGYNDYPVVGVSWEQANAFCVWRTDFYERGMGKNARRLEPFRLPTEVEWEYAARAGKSENKYPWDGDGTIAAKGCSYANFKPERGNYVKDEYLITARVASFAPNDYGLYDMAGNLAEWTSTAYTEAGILSMDDINPENKYTAAKEDPYRMKKKTVRGGSWKDVATMIRSDLRSFEYQNQGRSYIGFRCVKSRLGYTGKK